MSSAQERTRKSPAQELKKLIGEDNLKDIKFAGAAFVAIVVMIFHYAWIVRQMLMDFEMPTRTIYIHFGFFGVTVIACIAVLVKYVYPRIYTQVVSEEKKTQ